MLVKYQMTKQDFTFNMISGIDINAFDYSNNYRQQTKLREGNGFTGIYLSMGEQV